MSGKDAERLHIAATAGAYRPWDQGLCIRCGSWFVAEHRCCMEA